MLSLLTAVPSVALAADAAPVMHDTMQRTVASGWGQAPTGGAYEVSAGAPAGVQPGTATITAPGPGRTATVAWQGEAPLDVQTSTILSLPTRPSGGGGSYFSAHARHSATGSYAARLRVLPDGRVEFELLRVEGWTAVPLAAKVLGLGNAIGSGVKMELRVEGTSPVRLHARAWPAGQTVPEWQLEHSDSSAKRIATGGKVAWSNYASTADSIVPVHVSQVSVLPTQPLDAGTPELPETPDPTPTPPATNHVVNDAMSRNVASGWGAADVGGAWQASAGAALSVAQGVGRIASPAPGRTSVVTLREVRARDVQSSFDVRIPQLPVAGSGVYLSHTVRAGASGAYAVRIWVRPGGSGSLALVQFDANLTTARVLSEVKIDQVTTGTVLRVVTEVSGADSVALAAKVWPRGAAEPARWQLTAKDAQAGRVSAPGGVGFSLYTSGGTQVVPFEVDNLVTTPASGEPGAPDVKPDPEPTPDPKPDPTPDPAPGDAVTGVRGAPGAGAPGSFSYPVPAGAIIVSPKGSDANPGTQDRPVKTVTAALRAVPNGGTIVLRGGTYHEFALIPPQKRVTMQPFPGEAVWFDGARPVEGWRAAGGVWVKDNWDVKLDSSPTFTRGAPDGSAEGWQFVNPARPMAAHPDQLWVGGTALREVQSRGQVGNGTFYVDDANKQLVMGANPSGKLVEASVLTQAISLRSAGSELRGIGVRRYATSVPDMGSVVVAANDVKLTDVTIRDNSTIGFYTWSLRTTLNRVSLINNGLLGGGAATADGLKITGMLSQGNNSEGFNRAPVSGAFKVGRSRGVSITDSAFVENQGQGPWFDESVYNITFTGNDVIGNTGNGLVLELSERAVVADNIVAKNALSGILIANSGNVQVWNNTVVGNTRNINVSMDKRRASDTSAAGHDRRQPVPDPTVPWITRNTVISNNVVSNGSGNCVVCVEDYSRMYTGAQMVSATNNNLYQRVSATAPTWFGVWSRGTIVNPSVFKTPAEFSASTGHERGSRFIDGGASLVTPRFILAPEHAASQGATAQAVPSTVAAVSRLKSGTRTLGAQQR